MIRFLLNQKEINTALPPGMLLLDFIRYRENLKGTKIGCREGDCGACTVLIGEIKEGKLFYAGATSCLMALGNAAGKHIVTVEGLNIDGLNAVQQAFADEGATQCGFCTPGFIVSLGGFCMSDNTPSYEKGIDSVNGNICRCTGYKSIERAVARINNLLSQRAAGSALQFAVDNNIIPGYFLNAEEDLRRLRAAIPEPATAVGNKVLGGGTDLYVQQHDTMPYEQIHFLFDRNELKGIRKEGKTGEIGAAATVTDIADSPVFKDFFPGLANYIRLISSTPIRNMATVGGNFTNASPIGDLTIFFLALDAQLTLMNGSDTRTIPLKSFYKGYKILDKQPGEIITKISFTLPGKEQLFNFEKVSKRTCLDIASVNTAILLTTEGHIISKANISAGGVGPIPLFLLKSSEWLTGKPVTTDIVEQLIQMIQSEISPISDARGTATYKRLLLAQLIKAHFISLFPHIALQQLTKLPA
ncbi:MAG: FAD binding domain-containing protein [Ferruginibacter sp.]